MAATEALPAVAAAIHSGRRTTAVVAANWLAFLSIWAAFILLMVHGFRYKGPGTSVRRAWVTGIACEVLP